MQPTKFEEILKVLEEMFKVLLSSCAFPVEFYFSTRMKSISSRKTPLTRTLKYNSLNLKSRQQVWKEYLYVSIRIPRTSLTSTFVQGTILHAAFKVRVFLVELFVYQTRTSTIPGFLP